MNKQSVIVKNLSKSYNNKVALNNISFEVKKGELFGFIGPDGAGKTTLFRILATLLIPDEGSAIVESFDVIRDYKSIRKIVGYMPGRFSLYQDLSVEENLKFFATIFGTTIKENYELIKDIYVQIEPFKNRIAGKLSGGMKQKLALSCALIHRPKVLFLDEPTTGVDAVSRKEFWEMLKKLNEKGISIIVSTPYMDEARSCNRVALINNGEILSIDTPENIIMQNDQDILAVKTNDLYKLILDLRSYEKTDTAFLFGEYVHLCPIKPFKDLVLLEEYLQSKQHHDIIIKKIKPGIEDCFMKLMKRSI
ncbi:MAG: ABC transporter ATP-binding protein [Bacteroidales bacterium]|nr:ABC transporter ATP-binding protein [Bacteroidales bacterium]